jgi:hypothetical protein
MVSIPKVVGVLSCGVVLCLSLSNITQAAQAADEAPVTDNMKSDPCAAGQPELSGCDTDAQENVDTIKGEVLRIQGDHFVVQRFTGQEVRLHTDANTQTAEGIRRGDYIEAEVSDVRDMNDQKRVRSIRRIE